jgi:hypothetical protein
MTLSTSTYDARARVPLRSASTRLSHSKSDSSIAATSEESSIGGTSRKRNRLVVGRRVSSLKSGPEFQPITLTAYETGKRVSSLSLSTEALCPGSLTLLAFTLDHAQHRYYSLDRRSQASVSSSSNGSSSEESDNSDDEQPARPAAQRGNNQITLYRESYHVPRARRY